MCETVHLRARSHSDVYLEHETRQAGCSREALFAGARTFGERLLTL